MGVQRDTLLIGLLLVLVAPASFADDGVTPADGNKGLATVSAGIVNDQNFTFGRYNGWDDDQAQLALDLDLSTWQGSDPLFGAIDHAELAAENLGRDTGSASLTMGSSGNFSVSLALVQQQQSNNFTGRTPFSGGEALILPADWLASNTTAGMLGFDSSSRRFEQELERERWSIQLNKKLPAGMALRTGFSSEEKSGTDALSAAIYIDASNGHATTLPRKVDTTTNTFDLGFSLSRNSLNLDLSYLYSDFDNKADGLSWQNPFNAGFGPAVDYPNGIGQIALEPDNTLNRFRLLGGYRFNRSLRLQFDGAWARTEQDQNYLPYTANPALTVSTPLPRPNLDGEITVTTLNTSINYRPLAKLSLEARWRYEDRDNDSPRDAYLAVRGDGFDQPAARLSLYNSAHSREKNRVELEAKYRLPLATRVQLGYAYEELERRNAAVAKTEEDRYSFVISSRPFDSLQARLELNYADRAASSYEWDRAFLALFDPELIALIPESQQFNNHPLLFQYHLADREQKQAQLSLSYLPGSNWSVNFEYLLAENEYDESVLGLLEDERQQATLSATLQPSESIDLSAYLSFDRYDNEQRGRAFRGSIEKNPFEIDPPLPQASDPTRDWVTESDDESLGIGVNLRWRGLTQRLDAEVDFSLVDSRGEQTVRTFGAPDLSGGDLPDIRNEQQRLLVSGTYRLKERLSLKFDYQYTHYKDRYWGFEDVDFNTMDRVLWSGETNPNDDIHFFQVSVIYRLE